MTTNLGPGANGTERGWAADDAAASIFRIDQQLGRPADINEAGRSAENADRNRAAWEAYRDGRGPWAPYALGSGDSVHCTGLAADSDDWYDPAAAAVWRDNGWRQTARYNDDRDEPWHGEYNLDLDNHRNDTPEEEDTMSTRIIRHPNGTMFLIDETGADHLGDFGSADISTGELIGSAERVFGTAEQLSAREFDVAVAIADRRAARHRKALALEVVKIMRQP